MYIIIIISYLKSYNCKKNPKNKHFTIDIPLKQSIWRGQLDHNRYEKILFFNKKILFFYKNPKYISWQFFIDLYTRSKKYHNYLCITCITNFGLESGRINSCIYTYLRFLASKFVQLLINSYWLKIRIYSLLCALKYKIYANAWTYSHKNAISWGWK